MRAAEEREGRASLPGCSSGGGVQGQEGGGDSDCSNCSITVFEVQIDKKRAGIFSWHCVLFKVYTQGAI